MRSLRTYEDFLFQYELYSSIFGVFWYFFFTKKLMKSTYTRWCRDYFTFNITWIGCLALVLIYIRLVLLGIWAWCQSDLARKILSLKNPILIGLIRAWIDILAGSITKLQASKLQVYQIAIIQRTSCDLQAKRLQVYHSISFELRANELPICKSTICKAGKSI